MLVVVIAAALIAAVPAFADPIASKQAQARQVLAEIQQLDSQLEKAIEAYNGATIRLDQVRGQIRVNRQELKVGHHNLRVAQRRLGSRLRDLYVAGESNSTLEIVLGAKNLDDLLNRIETVNRVSSQDAQVLAEVRTFRTQVERQAVVLKRARAEQERVVAVRAATKRQIEQGLAQRQQMLSSIQSEIVKLRAEEARRQLALRLQAQARLAQQRQAQQAALQDAVVGVTASVPTSASDPTQVATVAPPSRYGGVVGIAMQYLGTPYVWGASGPGAFDCSGFSMYVYAKLGVSLPHNAAAQWGYGTYVSKDQLQPGDLVFFDGLGHMGIYIGGGQFVHAPHTGDVVKISSLNDSWYAATYVGAKRV